jgi:uracil-DNA glycosylase family 4
MKPAIAKIVRLEKRHTNCLWRRRIQSSYHVRRRTTGNDGDLSGKPFVGAAGRLLDASLIEAGIDRKKVYVTNVV